MSVQFIAIIQKERMERKLSETKGLNEATKWLVTLMKRFTMAIE